MELRSGGRKLSFDVLRGSGSSEEDRSLILGSNSDPVLNGVEESGAQHSIEKPNRRKRRHRGSKKNKAAATTTAPSNCSIPEDPIAEKCMISNSVVDKPEDLGRLSVNRDGTCTNRLEFGLNYRSCSTGTVFYQELTVPDESRGSMSILTQGSEVDCQNLRNDRFSFGELRQRTVNGDDASSRFGDDRNVETCVEANSGVKQKSEPNGNVVPRLETAGSLDWKRLMAEDPNYMFSADKSPFKCYMEEMFSGNSLRITTTFGNEKERERVYDTIFRLPWRCELVALVLLS